MVHLAVFPPLCRRSWHWRSDSMLSITRLHHLRISLLGLFLQAA